MNNMITKEEKVLLKTKGIMPQKQEEYFSIRVLSKVGYFHVREMIALTNIANKYGNGTLGVTSRAAIEVPYIKYTYVKQVLQYIETNDLLLDNGKTNLKSIACCKGNICNNGLVDTSKIASDIQKEFASSRLPSKFKIAVLGCPNGYGRAQSNDIGILPQLNVKIVKDNCIKCRQCINVCRVNALSIKNNIIDLDTDKCVKCGKCIGKCPTKAIISTEIDILIFIGGRLGRKARLGTPLKRKFKEDELVKIIKNIIEYFSNNAENGERLADLVERIGINSVEERILSTI